jgi:hypothetical protein
VRGGGGKLPVTLRVPLIGQVAAENTLSLLLVVGMIVPKVCEKKDIYILVFIPLFVEKLCRKEIHD